MIDSLSAVAAAVRNNTIAFFQAEFLYQLADHSVNVSEQRGIAVRQLVGRNNFLLWNYQNVDGCLRIDIVKCYTEIVFVDDLCRDFLIDDAFENCFF